ncbi:ATP-binding protein [Paenibacillus chondroitinus]|uniref:ATP-binding protein n=1 Tax=Paenibacillus chondroitinus TaxID=59842 RepID=A0ABU6DLA6_9BACL|nr:MULTISPECIES: ATP-binding protein [Paenibacillus]MCY9660710.1 ATP-binding protein [Paenibacillus anseongense]MEB4798110.1 ATP-binding protein [Paenibacillus chondroitinus]
MTLLEELNSRSNNGNMSSKLFILAQEVTETVTDHLKLINQQLPEFDIHDASHSKKIIGNMEGLMRSEVIKRLSSYEIFLLYMSGYLHDCAMALPAWEHHLLRMTEGMVGFTSNDLVNPIANDGKVPYKLSKALDYIKSNSIKLYNSYEMIKSYIFLSQNENELHRDMAERLVEYQQFRNGYSEELKQKAETGSVKSYLEYSDLIRYEYIRVTHAQRVEKYVRNLSSLFQERIGGVWGEALAKDLAIICRSHGESLEYIKRLEVQAGYFGEETANLQFVAVMLRIADILHFSHDRAPKSLFAEKMIHSKESLLHWKAKFQGVNYTLDEVDGNGKIKIKYMAYCDEPSLYYFILEYLDWIDFEIGNYFLFYQDMQYNIQTSHLADKYKLQIANKVDRSQIKYDENSFMPVDNLSFTLNQKKILELLMGVGLYKNKFLCLRELYQNALDACRCMISMLDNRHGKIKGNIEFGLGQCIENNKTRTYLYCLDNGIGMTRETIVKYFLNIGNSFYKSKDFQQKNAAWGRNFKPTSQFGIGILSCFMIGDKLEITTKALTDDEKNGEIVRFSIDGPHEHFYYMKPDELDIEKIEQHGTLIKVFLNDDIIIFNDNIEQLDLAIHGQNKEIYRDKNIEFFNRWKNHLFYIIYDSIAIPNNNVDINIKMEGDKEASLEPWITPFDVIAYDISDIKLMYSDYRYFSDGYNPIDDYIRSKPFIDTRAVKITSEDVEYHYLFSLPLAGFSECDYRILLFEKALFKESTILVDGIAVGDYNRLKFDFNENRDLIRNGTIEFVEVPLTARDFARLEKIELKLFDARKLSRTAELILFGKIFMAEYVQVCETNVTVESKTFRELGSFGRESFNNNLPGFVVKADKWLGQYEEYDLVSSLWPVIPEKLYCSLNDDFEVVKIGERVKTVGNYGNSQIDKCVS